MPVYNLKNDECSKLIDQQKQAKLQWLQNPNQINRDNLQNLRCDTSRIFRTQKKEYLKGKINELETYNKNKKLEICAEAYMNLRKGTNLELIL
jgi:uncharacterized NAD(P)/FAD-binding protein YdhS